jgi:hypothetical protein
MLAETMNAVVQPGGVLYQPAGTTLHAINHSHRKGIKSSTQSSLLCGSKILMSLITDARRARMPATTQVKAAWLVVIALDVPAHTTQQL